MNTLDTFGVKLVGDNDTVVARFPLPTVLNQPNENGDYVGSTGTPFDPQLSATLDTDAGMSLLLPQAGTVVIDVGDVAELPMDDADLDGDMDTAEQLPVDQRGNARISRAGVDLGAVEDQPVALTGIVAIAPVNDTLRTLLLKK